MQFVLFSLSISRATRVKLNEEGKWIGFPNFATRIFLKTSSRFEAFANRCLAFCSRDCYSAFILQTGVGIAGLSRGLIFQFIIVQVVETFAIQLVSAKKSLVYTEILFYQLFRIIFVTSKTFISIYNLLYTNMNVIVIENCRHNGTYVREKIFYLVEQINSHKKNDLDNWTDYHDNIRLRVLTA